MSELLDYLVQNESDFRKYVATHHHLNSSFLCLLTMAANLIILQSPTPCPLLGLHPPANPEP